MRVITLSVEVRVSDSTGENEVETALNAALDETQENGLFWEDWEVGPLRITDVRRENTGLG